MAFSFAYLEVLKQRDRNQRGHRLLDRELIERLVKERADHELQLQVRLDALEHCLQCLVPEDRELIRLRYQGKIPIEELVEQSGTSRRTLFRNLDRIRRLLFDCISNRIANGDVP